MHLPKNPKCRNQKKYADNAQLTTCDECGMEVTKGNLGKHKKTKRHPALIAEFNAKQEEEKPKPEPPKVRQTDEEVRVVLEFLADK